jgi:hypothetical protein
MRRKRRVGSLVVTTLMVALLGLAPVSASAQRRTLDRHGERLGDVRENPYGGVDLYDKRGDRIGYGRVSPYDQRSIEIFDREGRRLLDVRPQRGQEWRR